MANERILSAPNGDRDTPVTFPMDNYEFGTGGSGHVPEGIYMLDCLDAKWVDRKNDAGKNLAVTWVVAGPDEYKGVKIMAWHPAPAGDEESDDYQKAVRRFRSLYASIADSRGLYEQVKNAQAKLTPKAMCNPEKRARAFALLTEDEDNRGSVRSGVAFYVGAKDYHESPGPAKGLPTRSTARVESAGQQANVRDAADDIFAGVKVPGNGASTASQAVAEEKDQAAAMMDL